MKTTAGLELPRIRNVKTKGPPSSPSILRGHKVKTPFRMIPQILVVRTLGWVMGENCRRLGTWGRACGGHRAHLPVDEERFQGGPHSQNHLGASS